MAEGFDVQISDSINLDDILAADTPAPTVPQDGAAVSSLDQLSQFDQMVSLSISKEDLLDTQETGDDDLEPQQAFDLPPGGASLETLSVSMDTRSPTSESVDLGSGSEAAISTVSSLERGIQELGITANPVQSDPDSDLSANQVSNTTEGDLFGANDSARDRTKSDLSKFFGSTANTDDSAGGFFDSLPGDKSLILDEVDKSIPSQQVTPQASEILKEETVVSHPAHESEKKLPHKIMTQTSEQLDVSFEGPPLSADDEAAMSRVDSVSQFFAAANSTEGANKGIFDDFMASETEDTSLPSIGSPRNTQIVAPSTSADNTTSADSTEKLPSQASPLTSPVHIVPPSPVAYPTQMALSSSPLPSPVHYAQPTQPPPVTQPVAPPVAMAMVSDEKHTTHCSPFRQNSYPGGEDPFSSSLKVSDSDRRHDAWIPSENTQQILIKMATSPPGTFFPTGEHLTCPGVLINDPQGDPVRDLVYRFMGEHEAKKRQSLSAPDVSQDVQGMQQLIRAECWRSAIDLSGKLLSECGQGVDKINQPSYHTAESLQLWFTRIALVVKLRMYSHAESELQAFGNLDRPDMFYEFYPDVYPGRKGSLVPFSFRLLHAELPLYLGKSQEALDRLYYMLAVAQKILVNVENGLAEDGSLLDLSQESRSASKNLWQSREVRILFAIINCFLSIKDYQSALTVLEDIELKDVEKFALWSGIGRVYLQMGDIVTADSFFQKAEKVCNSADKKVKCKLSINKGFVALGHSAFEEAMEHFREAVDLDPTNGLAVNNMAVCALYMGELKQALHTLEDIVQAKPSKFLQEGILFNLCTLYELESSCAGQKKQALLDLVSKNKGNGFNVACLKMLT